MKTKNKTLIFVLLAVLLGLYFYKDLPSVIGWGAGPNYKNVSVRTTVNVTDSYPEIVNITCNNRTSITLNAGTTQSVVCIVQIMDFNGGNTINGTMGSGVNATFYYYLNQSSNPNDNNVHYTNSTCSQNGSANGYLVNWSCAFDVWYYANNGTWRLNATVTDTHNWYYRGGLNFTVWGVGNATINSLYALNVTSLIDYGQLAVGDTSAPVTANVTNFGNMNINVTVFGYGNDTDSVSNRNLAMACEQRNISISNERYSLSSATAYDAMTMLAGVSTPAPQISGLTIMQQTNDSQQVINSTYWRLYVNVSTNPFGICNGTVVFSAETA
jgi:hypothetical protein